MHNMHSVTNSRMLIMGLMLLASTSLHAQSPGEKLFLQNCAVCHAADGGGAMPGVQDLAGSPTWTKHSDKEILTLVKQGIQKPGAAIAMPPKGGNARLADNELMEIISYMRAAFSK
ncbi:MAG: c-type cytochrome [Gammaproteobacteria bacterium]|nr:c-type cytochrome [Gammaproteobacteria bacterium]